MTPTERAANNWAATPAELVMRRERMGLSQTELGKLLGVGDRAVRRWEAADRAMSEPPELKLVELEAEFATAVDAVAGTLEAAPIGFRTLATYRTDVALKAAHPEAPWPASMYRAAAWAVVERVPFVSVMFTPEPPTEEPHDCTPWLVPIPDGQVCTVCSAPVVRGVA